MISKDGPEPPSLAVDTAAARAAGRAHEKAGRLREALSEYDRALRLCPDAVLAQRVVRLRHAEATARPRPAGVSVWPPEFTDPFPGAEGPPEVGRDDLTVEVLGGAIVHHGCLIVRGLVDEERALTLREHVDHSIDARDRMAAGEAAPGDDEWYRPFEPRDPLTNRERHWVREAGGMLTADAPQVLWEVLEGLGRAGAIDAITDYLGEPPVLSVNKCVLRKLRHSAPTWHQDGKFLGSTVRTVDVWLALTECGAGTTAPGLDIVPTRFEELLVTQTDGAIFQDSIGQAVVDRAAPDRPWVTPHFAPGDSILFDERFVHRSSVGEAFEADRYAVETWFFAASAFPEAHLPIAV